ncbi:MAG: GNAT family N-acetyltransferase [Pseudomonadota bacterium]
MIRKAVRGDLAAVERIVHEAYAPLAARMDRPPAPMQDDYAARIAEGAVWVAEPNAGVAGILVLSDLADALMLENVAVAREAQGQGVGRLLTGFAESEALRRGFDRIRLYTHITMVENQSMYRHLGYREIGKGLEDGFERVQFAKDLGH